jgi:DNA repair protein RadC
MRIYEAKLTYSLVSLGEDIRLDSPEKVVSYLQDAFDANPVVETFMVILLNRKGYPIGRHTVTVGTATGSLVHARETFKAAILAGATAVVAAHNHPSGSPEPSAADITVTRRLREAAQILDIDLLDHVVIGDKRADPAGKGYYSFRQAGLL